MGAPPFFVRTDLFQSDYVLVWSDPSKMMMVGSFGASAVLLFGVPAGVCEHAHFRNLGLAFPTISGIWTSSHISTQLCHRKMFPEEKKAIVYSNLL